jgi:hypothetical protein
LDGLARLSRRAPGQQASGSFPLKCYRFEQILKTVEKRGCSPSFEPR